MTIVKLERVTLFGPSTVKQTIIERLQQLGCMHLTSLRHDMGSSDAVPDVSQEARGALKYLKQCSDRRRQRRSPAPEPAEIVASAMQLRRQQRELEEERDLLLKAIQTTEPWGDFAVPDPQHLRGMRLWFFLVPLEQAYKLPQIDVVWEEVTRREGHLHLVVCSGAEPEGFPGQRVELDPRSLADLRRCLETVETRLADVQYERVGLTQWVEVLEQCLDRADDAAARQRATQYSLELNNVFAIQGWAPVSSHESLRALADAEKLAITFEPPTSGDDPPTLLRNPEPLAGGEGCVTFYKTPGYQTWDPSIVVFFSFSLFFAMILADAGYALLLAVPVLWKWKALRATAGARRFRNLLLSLIVTTFVYGMLAGSYFGITPSPESPWGRLHVLDIQDQAVMMPLSIGIGIAHLALANFVSAWQARRQLQALASLGWVSIMIGSMMLGMGLLSFAGSTADLFKTSGTILLVSGALAVFVFTSQRNWRNATWRTHLLRCADGLMGLTRFSALFGDSLSYLRLFALGLSSAQLAVTFNGLAKTAWAAHGVGVLLAIGIVVLGHFLNLLLGVMSGVVHGLRLNCIEFFNWSLPDEGRLFSAFAKKAR